MAFKKALDLGAAALNSLTWFDVVGSLDLNQAVMERPILG